MVDLVEVEGLGIELATPPQHVAVLLVGGISQDLKVVGVPPRSAYVLGRATALPGQTGQIQAMSRGDRRDLL